MRISFTIFFLVIYFSVYSQSNVDTVYSGQVTTKISVQGFDLEGGIVNYTLHDTVTNTFLFIVGGETNNSGEYIIDSLPVLKHSTGIDETNYISDLVDIVVTNSGGGAYHMFIVSTLDESISEGFIYNLQGRLVKNINLSFNKNTNKWEGFWNGQSDNSGVYIFVVSNRTGIYSEKFVHMKSSVYGIHNYSPLSFHILKNKTEINDEAISRYIRSITSPFTESYEDTIYIHEDITHYFEAELEHLPIDSTSIEGSILVNEEFPAYNAILQIKNLTNGNIIYNLQVDTNGFYDQEDMPVPIDALFSNPETTQYEITTTAQNPNNWQEKVDTLTLVSGENLLHNIIVQANPIDPGSLSGTILVNNQFPAYNANIQIKNITDDNIIFNLQADENGNYTQNGMPVPIDAIFTAPETTQYEVKTTAQNPNNFEEKVDLVDMVSGENLLHNISVVANPIADGSISGTILVNNQFPAYNANIHVENVDNPSISFDFQTDENGNYSQDDIPVPLDEVFTAPETAQYKITVQAQNPTNWEEEITNVNIISGENLDVDIDVEAFPIDDAQVEGQVLLNGETPIANANLHWKNLNQPSITYDMITNAQGEYEEDVSVPLDALFTNPEDTEYEVTTTGDNLETKIDTFMVISGQQTTNNILVFPTPYANGEIQALLRYQDDNQGVPFANVEYKQLNNQSQIFTTITTTNGAYSLEVPVIYEPENPGQTSYIIKYSPSENTDPLFFTKIDTILISPGLNSFLHYVDKNIVEPSQDIEGVVKDAYTKDIASGITVRLIDRTNGQVIEEDITGPDGKYSFEDLAPESEVEFELGSNNHFWLYNTEYDVPTVIGDTLVTFNRLAYPKLVEVPMPGTNYTILGVGEEISEMVGSDYINFEEILRHIDNMHPTNPSNPAYIAALNYINDSIYEGNSPIVTVASQRNITPEMQGAYDPYTNFFPGLLGWNIDFGGGNITTHINAPTNYGVIAIIGGEMEATSGGSEPLAPVIKEIQYRRHDYGDVANPALGGRWSILNDDPVMPTEKDRAYDKVIHINQKARFDSGEETYSLEYVTDQDPNSVKSSNSNYKDVPGTQPHCKNHLNNKKLRYQ